MTVHYSKSDAEKVELAVPPQFIASSVSAGGAYRSFFKRFFDTSLVILSLPFVFPLVLILMAIVALDGSAPLYRQERVGKGGRVFRMWKIRTMVPEAEKQLARYLANNAEARAEWAASQKLKNDPRITKFGKFLRKSSFDELPQLWNVLRGDMSLVGPRPMMVCQTELYPGSAYYKLRPGITGFWQISDRNDSEFKSRAIYDNRYDQTVSFKTDLQVLWQTVGVVFKCTGY